MHKEHTGYLTKGMNNRQKNLAELASFCREVIGLDKFDGFVITGLSGALFGFSLADRLKKGFVFVRKTVDDTHSGHHRSGNMIESSLPQGSRLIFLDDLIASGKTRKRVYDAVKDNYIFAGQLLYGESSGDEIEFDDLCWWLEKNLLTNK